MFETKVVEKMNTILCSITFCQKSYRVWDNVQKCGGASQGADDNLIRRMRFACWITKATDIHLECLILAAFPRQQWFHESASVLRYTYIACLLYVKYSVGIKGFIVLY